MKKRIYYVVDRAGWVQHQRLRHLRAHQEEFDFTCLTAPQFLYVWPLLRFLGSPVYFSTWRIVHNFLKRKPNIFQDQHFNRFMVAVTSHSNIGGGLDPLNPIPGRKPEEAFELAVSLLRRFRVVTVNSLILKDMLKDRLPELHYCPNGVDASFFSPATNFDKPRRPLVVGWVGKIRGPKNFESMDSALQQLSQEGIAQPKLIKIEKGALEAENDARQMRDYYRNLDVYLCASWNEGTPNPALEAAACGVPLVSTRVGNMPDLIRHGQNGYFVDPSPASIVEMIRTVAKLGNEEYSAMSFTIRQSILQEWNWPDRISAFVAALRELSAA